MTQKTYTALNTEFTTNIADNTTSDVSPEDVRNALTNLMNSTWNSTTATSITNSASPYTLDIDATRFLLCDDTSGAITVNLPAVATYPNRVVTITKLSASNSVTIDGNASETINGATTLVLSGQYDSVTIANNGTAWYVQSSHSL